MLGIHCQCGALLESKCRRCRVCARTLAKQKRDERLENGATKQDVYNYTWRRNNPAKYLLQTAKSRAKKSGFDFNLTPEDIIIPEFCPVLGIPLFVRLSSGGDGKNPNNPSLDRIDSSKGYVKGNVQIISWRANDLKKNGTLEEFKKLVEFLNAEKRGV